MRPERLPGAEPAGVGDPGPFAIRAVRDSDHDAVHTIITSPHVVAGSMRVPLTPVSQTRARLTPRAGQYQIVAEAEDRVVGFGELVHHPDEPRHRHAGEINLVATHADWCGRGIGRALTLALVDLADNWLNLTRLGLIVFTNNTHAIRLYQSLGFTIEGTMPRVAFGAGRWMDAHMMGRLCDVNGSGAGSQSLT
jgi:putative acetyltransferase